MSVVIEPAHTNDVPALFALLEQSGLPQEGLHDHVATTLVAREDQIIMGSAALEIYGKRTPMFFFYIKLCNIVFQQPEPFIRSNERVQLSAVEMFFW